MRRQLGVHSWNGGGGGAGEGQEEAEEEESEGAGHATLLQSTALRNEDGAILDIYICIHTVVYTYMYVCLCIQLYIYMKESKEVRRAPVFYSLALRDEDGLTRCVMYV